MMGREFIYPGDKQIRALLSPAHRGTTAYINILSWAIQVSKGFTHPYFHKGPPSTFHPTAPWPHGCRSLSGAGPRTSRLCYFPAMFPFCSQLFCTSDFFTVTSERSKKLLIPSDTGESLADRQDGVRREKQNWADIFGHVAVIYGPVQDSNFKQLTLCVCSDPARYCRLQ